MFFESVVTYQVDDHCMLFPLQITRYKFGKNNNVSAEASFKSQTKREIINLKEARSMPAPGRRLKVHV